MDFLQSLFSKGRYILEVNISIICLLLLIYRFRGCGWGIKKMR